MPVNIVFDPNSETLGGVEQSLFAGTSYEQVDGLVELLMNFGEYSIQKQNVADMVKPAPAEAATSANADQDTAARVVEPQPRTAQAGS